MKIIEWDLLCGDDTYEIGQAVKKAIGDGWQPHGDARMTSEAPHRRIWFQVMVKGEDDNQILEVLTSIADRLTEIREEMDSIDRCLRDA